MIADFNNSIIHKEIEISESELNKLVSVNFNLIFPGYILIESEFELKGNVRRFGSSGRIDILALDDQTNEIIVIELKQNHDKNILIQAIDYCDFIEENLEHILIKTKNLNNRQKEKLLREKKAPKIILVAKEFHHPTLRRMTKISNPVDLYTYNYYEGNLLRIYKVSNNDKTDKDIQLKTKEIQSGNHTIDPNILISQLRSQGKINDEFCKIENGAIIINPTKLYEAYKKLELENDSIPLSKSGFFDAIKRSNKFIEIKSASRFKDKNTSAYVFKAE